MGVRYFEEERSCLECAERFWGTRRANYCSNSCRLRAWRARRVFEGAENIEALCKEVIGRGERGSRSYAKLYTQLLRAVAAEMRRRGADPIEALISLPDEPATDSDTAPGGIEGRTPKRRRWLHPPDEEIERLKTAIEEREARQANVTWHAQRLDQLLRWKLAELERFEAR